MKLASVDKKFLIGKLKAYKNNFRFNSTLWVFVIALTLIASGIKAALFDW